MITAADRRGSNQLRVRRTSPNEGHRTGVSRITLPADGLNMQKAEGSAPGKSFARLLAEAATAIGKVVRRMTNRR